MISPGFLAGMFSGQIANPFATDIEDKTFDACEPESLAWNSPFLLDTNTRA